MKHLFKLLIASLLIITLSADLLAKEVNETVAKTVATNYLNKVDNTLLNSKLSLVYARENVLYVFGNENSFVIVSANDVVKPVLAYSTDNSFVSFDDKPQGYGINVLGLLDHWQNQIDSLVAIDYKSNQQTKNQWQSLISSEIVSQARNDKGVTTVVEPLLTTTWGQGWPYNADCPVDVSGPGGHVWVGCVGTAMAQIIHYNNEDQSMYSGVGNYSYTWQNYPETSVDFGNTVYDMVSMPTYVSDISDPGADEIAKLSYHAAAGCRSMWGAGSTGVMFSGNGYSYVLGDYPMMGLIENYLPMKAGAKWMNKTYYTDVQWHDALQNELQNDRVVYYRGNGDFGHGWVVDGFDENNLYHMNFGWSGNFNGYYALDAISPGGQYLGDDQMMMIGLAPNDGSTITSNTTWSGTIDVNNINIPEDLTLTINPGTTINFSPGCAMRVWGRILSNGTQSSMVKFTASDQTDGWEGIHFHEDYLDRMQDNDTSRFVYTQVEYSKSCGIYIYDYGKVTIDDCIINDNDGYIGAGIYCTLKSIRISNTEVYNNNATGEGGGVYMNFNDNVSVNISGNYFHDNSAVEGGFFVILSW